MTLVVKEPAAQVQPHNSQAGRRYRPALLRHLMMGVNTVESCRQRHEPATAYT